MLQDEAVHRPLFKDVSIGVTQLDTTWRFICRVQAPVPGKHRQQSCATVEVEDLGLTDCFWQEKVGAFALNGFHEGCSNLGPCPGGVAQINLTVLNKKYFLDWS
jgi:hypothetical protein